MKHTTQGNSHKTTANVEGWERIISAAAGAFLLFNGLKSKNSKLLKTIAGSYLLYRGISGHCHAYSLMGRKGLPEAPNVSIDTSLTVNKSRHEVYAFWRRLENIPLFMKHIESVNAMPNNRSEWKAKIPGVPASLRWEAVVIEDEPGEILSWASLPEADIQNAGTIEFRDAGENMTEIHVTIVYQPPMGRAGAGISKLFTPLFRKMIKNDIKNFKRYMETGETTTIIEEPAENPAFSS